MEKCRAGRKARKEQHVTTEESEDDIISLSSEGSNDRHLFSSKIQEEDGEDTDPTPRNATNNIFLSVSVSDEGDGMNDDLKKKCFVLFGNLKFKQDVNQGTMGLGLTASNQICKALNGELNLIRSERDVGSKFQFSVQIQLGRHIPNPNLFVGCAKVGGELLVEPQSSVKIPSRMVTSSEVRMLHKNTPEEIPEDESQESQSDEDESESGYSELESGEEEKSQSLEDDDE
eukprot:CAMPEP_0170500332 /NCGR_PEP_ID=MMETSP0208-20121228/34469_1 /TAXON_ID=197538 /ORGANISM="Strombidium inclinatum, Strain S3" /LENGTH=229 /DNA_ID=CAMNT_0010778319 /DNA_START=1766 /DNA_END=2455 /DNA_ORIENTATION=-